MDGKGPCCQVAGELFKLLAHFARSAGSNEQHDVPHVVRVDNTSGAGLIGYPRLHLCPQLVAGVEAETGAYAGKLDQ